MRILLCTDGSANGLSAVQLGGKIAARLGAEVTLLYVENRKRRDPERSLERTAVVMRELGASFTGISRRGGLIEGMLAQMLDVEYDLVIVGYYARSYVEKVLWGSVATHIAHELPASVLIVRDLRDTINQVLVGISGGGFTLDCVDWGARIAVAFDAHITLLHVSQSPPLMYAGLEEVAESLTEFLQADTAAAQAIRQAVSRLTAMGVEADLEFVHGMPERELLRVGQTQDVDLLVLGSSWAVQPLRRALLRNIAEKVLLGTRRPVLVVRPSGQEG